MERRPDDRRVARFIEERAAQHPAATRLGRCGRNGGIGRPADPAGAAGGFRRAARCRGQCAAARRRASVHRSGPGAAPGRAIGLAGVLALLAVARSRPRRCSRRGGDGAAGVVAAVARTSRCVPGDARVPAGQPFRIRAVVRSGGRVITRLQPSLVVSRRRVSAATVPMAPGRRRLRVRRSMPSIGPSPTGSWPSRSDSRDVHRVGAGRAKVDGSTRTTNTRRSPAWRRATKRTAATSTRRPARASGCGCTPTSRSRPARCSWPGRQTARHSAQVATRCSRPICVLTKDDAYRVPAGGRRRAARRRRDGVLHPADGRSTARGPHPAAERRPADHPARGSGDRGARRRRLRRGARSISSTPWPGGPSATTPFSRVSGTNVAKIGAPPALGRGAAGPAGRRDHRIRPGARHRAAASARPKRRATCSSSRSGRSTRSSCRRRARRCPASGDPQLESLIAAQKEIINATWNIERRSAAGRSAADVKVGLAGADRAARPRRAA